MDLKQELGAKQKKGTALSQFFQNRDGVVSMGPNANEYPAGTEDRNVGTTCYHREKQRDGARNQEASSYSKHLSLRLIVGFQTRGL